MERRNTLIAAAIILLTAITGLIGLLGSSSYEKFSIQQEERNGTQMLCTHYEAECTCYGTLTVMESYPPQYDCSGIERCSPMDEVSCESR